VAVAVQGPFGTICAAFSSVSIAQQITTLEVDADLAVVVSKPLLGSGLEVEFTGGFSLGDDPFPGSLVGTTSWEWS
jgi:hypothetical protein